MKKPIFVTSNSNKAAKSRLYDVYRLFCCHFSSISVPYINGATPTVKGLKTFALCLGWTHGKGSTVFCCPSTHLTSKKTMRNTVNGLPAGESNLHDAELRQLFKSYLNNIGGLDSLKEGGFQLMESLVASMEVLGLDSDTVLHYFYVCRCTVEFISDLDFILEHSNSSQPCN